MEPLLACPVCYEQLDHSNRLPKVLACGHTLCILCAVTLLGKVEDRWLACPQCRNTQFLEDGRCTSLPTNYLVLKFADYKTDFQAERGSNVNYADENWRFQLCKDDPVTANAEDGTLKHAAKKLKLQISQEIDNRIQALLTRKKSLLEACDSLCLQFIDEGQDTNCNVISDQMYHDDIATRLDSIKTSQCDANSPGSDNLFSLDVSFDDCLSTDEISKMGIISLKKFDGEQGEHNAGSGTKIGAIEGTICGETDIEQDEVSNEQFVSTSGSQQFVAQIPIVSDVTKKVDPISVFGEQGTLPGMFDGPSALACMPAGLLAIADYNNKRIQIVDMLGNSVPIFAANHTSNINYIDLDFKPKDIAVDARGFLVVLSATHLQLFDPRGQLVEKIPVSSQCKSVAVNDKQNIFTIMKAPVKAQTSSTLGDNCIVINEYEYNGNATNSLIIDEHTLGVDLDFQSPRGLALFEDRYIFALVHYLVIVSKSGIKLRVIDMNDHRQTTSGVWGVQSVACSESHVVVVDASDQAVHVFSNNGQHLNRIDGFILPRGVSVNKRGNLIVCSDDRGNKIYVY